MEWSDLNLQELRKELEWIYPGRMEGPVLAKMAFDRLEHPESSTLLNHLNSEERTCPSSDPTSEVSALQTYLDQMADPWTGFAVDFDAMTRDPNAAAHMNSYSNIQENPFSQGPSSETTSQSDTAFAPSNMALWAPTPLDHIAPALFEIDDFSLARCFRTLQFQDDGQQTSDNIVEQAAAPKYTDYPEWYYPDGCWE